MRTSKRKFEGMIQIDHRDSPGITPEQAQGRGPAVGEGQFFEAPTYGCVHCQRITIMNPLRTKPRPYCQKCDDYLCAPCEGLIKINPHLPHKPFAQIIDDLQNEGAKGQALRWP